MISSEIPFVPAVNEILKDLKIRECIYPIKNQTAKMRIVLVRIRDWN